MAQARLRSKTDDPGARWPHPGCRRRKAMTPPKGAQIVNLSGKTVTPGFHSTHVHISDVQGVQPAAYTRENTERQLGVYARYGITTLWSLGGEQAPAFEARAAQNTSSLNRSRLSGRHDYHRRHSGGRSRNGG